MPLSKAVQCMFSCLAAGRCGSKVQFVCFFLTESRLLISLLCYVAYSKIRCGVARTHIGFLLMHRHTNRVGLGSSCAFKTLINYLLVQYYESDRVSAQHRGVHTQMWLVENDSLVEWPSVYFYTLWTGIARVSWCCKALIVICLHLTRCGWRHAQGWLERDPTSCLCSLGCYF